jgi:hypothetical protein
VACAPQVEVLQQALRQANSQLHVLGGTPVEDPVGGGVGGVGGQRQQQQQQGQEQQQQQGDAQRSHAPLSACFAPRLLACHPLACHPPLATCHLPQLQGLGPLAATAQAAASDRPRRRPWAAGRGLDASAGRRPSQRSGSSDREEGGCTLGPHVSSDSAAAEALCAKEVRRTLVQAVAGLATPDSVPTTPVLGAEVGRYDTANSQVGGWAGRVWRARVAGACGGATAAGWRQGG